jgi:hypothetical protein
MTDTYQKKHVKSGILYSRSNIYMIILLAKNDSHCMDFPAIQNARKLHE